MLARTHLAIIALAILILIESVEYKIPFVIFALIATLLPDLDNGFSTLGKQKQFKILRFFTKHRGVMHSFTFCFLITILLVLFLPILALGFFLGYGLHVFVDSFTVDGIKPFWPFKKTINGKLRVGTIFETTIFVFFVLVDVMVLIFAIY